MTLHLVIALPVWAVFPITSRWSLWALDATCLDLSGKADAPGVIGAMFRVAPDLPHFTFLQLTHLLSRRR